MVENLLKEWQTLLEKHIDNILDFLIVIRSISQEYDRNSMIKFDPGFNIFTLTSDFYFRENYHSDIIKAFLDPKEKHGEDNLFLKMFIQMLKKFNRELEVADYLNSTVTREEAKIDICIKNEQSKKAIIIEDKINNAVDMDRQIPRYYDYLTRIGYQVEAVVYLPLDANKRPDKSTWTEDDKKNVNPLLLIVPAFLLNGGINLVKDWIDPCILRARSMVSLSILQQYKDIIKYLNTNAMDNVSLEEFYNTLKKGDNYKTAMSIQNMLNDLPLYLKDRIKNHYENNIAPFTKIWIYGKTDVVIDLFHYKDNDISLDIICSNTAFELQLWVRNGQEDIRALLQRIDSIKDWSYHAEDLRLHKIIAVMDEELLYSTIDKLLFELSKLQ